MNLSSQKMENTILFSSGPKHLALYLEDFYLGLAGQVGGLTHVKELLGGSDGDPAQCVLVLLIHHLVAVHAFGLVQPEADEVQREFQDLCGGEQEPLPQTRDGQHP